MKYEGEKFENYIMYCMKNFYAQLRFGKTFKSVFWNKKSIIVSKYFENTMKKKYNK